MEGGILACLDRGVENISARLTFRVISGLKIAVEVAAE
jgi:hypothetical protein